MGRCLVAAVIPEGAVAWTPLSTWGRHLGLSVLLVLLENPEMQTER